MIFLFYLLNGKTLMRVECQQSRDMCEQWHERLGGSGGEGNVPMTTT